MVKITKRKKIINSKINTSKNYDVIEALNLLKETTSVNFVESVDVAVKLGIDARKSDQNIRGMTILPNGTGRVMRVAVFTQGVNIQEAEKANADFVGMNDLADKIKNGEKKFDVVIASPDAMRIVGQLGQFLGPRGLMPNLKLGTVTENIFDTVKKAKFNQVRYRNDKYGIVHTTIGKINFDIYKLKENLEVFLTDLKRIKPAQSKGMYIKKINISTTMGCGILIDNLNSNITIH